MNNVNILVGSDMGLCKVRMRTADADGGCGQKIKKK